MAEANAVATQTDHARVIAALRERNAERFDPVRFHFIESLARRAEAYQGEARHLLDGRLTKALQEYSKRFELAQDKTEESAVALASPSLLAELAAYIAQRSSSDRVERVAPDGESTIDSPAATSTELKSVRYFRDTWSKLSVNQQLEHALAQAPENAGPLNSHLLVLRAFERMRDLSPNYLNRFIPYVDALLWLDQADSGKAAMNSR